MNEKGEAGEALRVAHERELYRAFLARLTPHSAIALEASGSYSWLVDDGAVWSPTQIVQSHGSQTTYGFDQEDR